MLHHFKVGPKHLQFQIYILFRASKRFRVAEVGRLSAKAKILKFFRWAHISLFATKNIVFVRITKIATKM